MDPLKIIRKYYKPDSLSYRMLVEHSRMVVSKCLEISENIRHLSPDLSFLSEAAMLHDIGDDQGPTSAVMVKDYVCHVFWQEFA
jgi:uncharacterized protein